MRDGLRLPDLEEKIDPNVVVGNRRERRMVEGKTSTRNFSNKKGSQILVTRLLGGKFFKVERHLQRLKGKTIISYINKNKRR